MAIKKEKVEEQYRLIEESIKKYDREFFIALFMYDVLKIEREKINDDIIKRIENILDDYPSYYDENLRDDIKEINEEREEELEEERLYI